MRGLAIAVWLAAAAVVSEQREDVPRGASPHAVLGLDDHLAALRPHALPTDGPCIPIPTSVVAQANITRDESGVLPLICWRPELVEGTDAVQRFKGQGIPAGVDCIPAEWCVMLDLPDAYGLDSCPWSDQAYWRAGVMKMGPALPYASVAVLCSTPGCTTLWTPRQAMSFAAHAPRRCRWILCCISISAG